MKFKNIKFAFTLAEVLITLGIIGIVAALTIPNLIANYKKHEVETKLAKMYSVMNQAVTRSEVDNGDLTSWVWDGGASSSTTKDYDYVLNWYNTYLAKYIVTTNMQSCYSDNKHLCIYFADGSILMITPYIHDMAFFINAKAMTDKKPGINYFLFEFNPVLQDYQISQQERWQYMIGKGIVPYCWNWDGTDESLLHNTYEYGCGDKYHAYCTMMIARNGWKIPKNYPLGF